MPMRPFTTLLPVACLFLASVAWCAPLTLEDVAALRDVTAVRLSPAGDRIAYRLRVPRELYKDDDGRPYQELHVVTPDGDSIPYVSGKVEAVNAN